MTDHTPAPSGATDQAPMAEVDIDTSGLKCPLPILRAKKALAGMTSGQVLRVLATDPNSIDDFEAFCRQTGNALLHQQADPPQFIHYLRRR